MKIYTRLFALLLCVLLLFALPSPALADIAPPEQNPGSNPSSDAGTTQVRMLEELVTIIPGPEVTINQYLTALQADVLAEFWMLNTGPEDETMQVRFPSPTQTATLLMAIIHPHCRISLPRLMARW